MMGQPFPGLYSHKYHPWTKEMHDCEAEVMVGQKGAQQGYTEVALNKCFYNIDILGNSVLYVLPTINDASDFSTSRFDPALELSPHLQNLFSDVKNMGHKRAGSANLFVRGSRSRNQLKSIPVSVAIIDELDEMVQDNIQLIFERMSGQLHQQAFLLSTPTVQNFGINQYFKRSTQEHFFFPCPHCSLWTQLVFPDCLIITSDNWSSEEVLQSYLICKECKHPLSHEAKPEYLTKGKWIAENTDRSMRGFHVNQLYSATVHPSKLAISYLKGLTNPADEQEFYNSKLGMPHETEGARISDKDIGECTSQYGMKDSNSSIGTIVTMGIDVGKWLHYEISSYTFDQRSTDVSLSTVCKVLKVGKVEHFEELVQLVIAHRVNYAVIDANPERRKALEFAQTFYGRVKLCFYGRGINGKAITVHPEEQHTLTVDRTSWLDLSLGRIKRRKISFPVDLPNEYKSHLKNLVRVETKDTDGNPVSRYQTTDGEDHYAHARNYNEIALQMIASLSGNQNIKGVL